MSYQERSVWFSLGIIIYIWFTYFSEAYGMHVAGELTVDSVNDLLVYVVLLTIGIEIGLQILIAAIDNRDADKSLDERDERFENYSYKYAYYILFFGIALSGIYTLFPQIFLFERLDITLPKEYQIFHIIIIFTLLAEITRLSTQIYYYRVGE